MGLDEGHGGMKGGMGNEEVQRGAHSKPAKLGCHIHICLSPRVVSTQ